MILKKTAYTFYCLLVLGFIIEKLNGNFARQKTREFFATHECESSEQYMTIHDKNLQTSYYYLVNIIELTCMPAIAAILIANTFMEKRTKGC